VRRPLCSWSRRKCSNAHEAVDVSGEQAGQRLRRRGYVELAGYANADGAVDLWRATVMEVTIMTKKPRRPENDRHQWTTVDLRMLKRLARDGSVMAAAKAIGSRPSSSPAESHAHRHSISLAQSRNRDTT
jgi:hypothetical protein